MVTGFPSVSSSVYPKSRSAPLFQLVMIPLRSLDRIASSDDSIIAASLWAANSCPRSSAGFFSRGRCQAQVALGSPNSISCEKMGAKILPFVSPQQLPSKMVPFFNTVYGGRARLAWGRMAEGWPALGLKLGFRLLRRCSRLREPHHQLQAAPFPRARLLFQPCWSF